MNKIYCSQCKHCSFPTSMNPFCLNDKFKVIKQVLCEETPIRPQCVLNKTIYPDCKEVNKNYNCIGFEVKKERKPR